MNLKEVVNIDFADSRYKSCEASEKKLTIFLESWQEKQIELTFFHPIYFVYQVADIGSGFYEKLDCESLLNELFHEYYDVLPEKNPFKAYVLLDIYDNEIFRVVAENVTALKRE